MNWFCDKLIKLIRRLRAIELSLVAKLKADGVGDYGLYVVVERPEVHINPSPYVRRGHLSLYIRKQ